MENGKKLFQEAVNQQAFLKAGVLGFAGSGKTFTSALIAKGISERLGKKNPVYFMDTETGSDFLVPRFKEWGIPFYVSKSRAFVDLLDGVKAAEENNAILIIDSISHFWKEVQDAYKKAKNRTRLQFQDWGPLKDQWGRFTDTYLNSRTHIILNGRAAFEYDYFQDGDGAKQLEKTGTKMKAETDMSYEPSLLIEMVRDKRPNKDGQIEGQLWDHVAYVLKDRTGMIEGKKIVNPTFADFEPVFNFLNIGGEHVGIQTNSDSSALFDKDSENDGYEIRRQKDILLEEIQGELVAAYPGQTVEEKRIKTELLYEVFQTRSWTKVGEMHTNDLKNGLNVMRERIDIRKQANGISA